MMHTLSPDPIVLERRVTALEAENIQLTERALGAEQRLARAAQLYASVAELHLGRDRRGRDGDQGDRRQPPRL